MIEWTDSKTTNVRACLAQVLEIYFPLFVMIPKHAIVKLWMLLAARPE